MRYALILAFLLPIFVLAQLKPATEAKLVETERYALPVVGDFTILELGYASARLQQTSDTLPWTGRSITQIDLVFTKYPHDFDQWIISYQSLLQNRLTSLQTIDPALLQDSSITWQYVLQTDCETEKEAKQLFHGFVVYYQAPDNRMREVEKIVYGKEALTDSSAYKVLERHKEWQEKLVVMDWTASMYPYGASVLLWHSLNLSDSSIKHFVFFNDGNGKSNATKKMGKTGGIFKARTNAVDSVIYKMYEVMQKGSGGDIEENDVEALFKGSSRLKGFKELVLIADNHSPVRDLHLAKHLKYPVKVVLCGVSKKYPIHPDYLQLARETGGSVHTIHRDIENLVKVKEGQTIRIGKAKYKLIKGKFRRVYDS
ncbi:MAG: hypothetical protein AAF206_02805 [Bacteroidota bacterium]